MNNQIHMVKPSAILLKDEHNEILTPYQCIELAGRNCYQSTSDFSRESSAKFCNQMISNGHGAMLEHGVFVFKITVPVEDMETIAHVYSVLRCPQFIEVSSQIQEDVCVCYASVSLRTLLNYSTLLSQMKVTAAFGQVIDDAYPEFSVCSHSEFEAGVDTGSAEVKLMSQEELYQELPEDAIYKCVFIPVRYITDRGVSHELVRHRISSFAQESTRYCNYSKDKHNGRVTFIEPYGFETWTQEQKDCFTSAMSFAEQQYLDAVKLGLKAQQARAILPNATKTDIVVTMNVAELIHFFNLRYYGLTGAPHPDMLAITTQSLPLIAEELSKYQNAENILTSLLRKDK